MKLRLCSALAAGLFTLPAVVHPQPALARSYPSRPIRVIVSTVPGPLDAFARIICDKVVASLKDSRERWARVINSAGITTE